MAIAAFDDVGGWNYTSAKVSVAKMDGAHWRYPVINGEIMIGAELAVSAITVQSFADPGYDFNLTQHPQGRGRPLRSRPRKRKPQAQKPRRSRRRGPPDIARPHPRLARDTAAPQAAIVHAERAPQEGLPFSVRNALYHGQPTSTIGSLYLFG